MSITVDNMGLRKSQNSQKELALPIRSETLHQLIDLTSVLFTTVASVKQL